MASGEQDTDITYNIYIHQHRLAAWAASTAARASKLCRFKVEVGVAILEGAGFTPSLSTPDQLPTPEKVDTVHLEWRERLISEAEKQGITFTHGIAAKLVNTYLKVRFICGGYHEHDNAASLHPPVDKLLLDMLADLKVGDKAKQWRQYSKKGWSKYSSDDYQKVIDLFRSVLDERPLWEIEKYWRGYQ